MNYLGVSDDIDEDK